MYTLCATKESVMQAIEVLSSAEYVFLDCEGRDLGVSSGALSLISLGTPHAEYIYLFDVLQLSHDALQALFNAVFSLTTAARSKMKVVWDGRMDYVELFYSYTSPIENVLDLQLVDVLSRATRSESDRRRLYRLQRRAFPISELKKLQLEEVHTLNGMDGAIEEHGIQGLESKNECVKKLHTNNMSDIWMQRPLSSELLAYAASDIKRIAGIYDHFFQHGYLAQMDHLRELSSHYVSMHRQTGKPDPENIFLRGPFLPLSIPLILPSADDGSTREKSKDCSGCKRLIAERHFPIMHVSKKKERKALTTSEPKYKYADESRSEWCKICTLILAKSAYAEKQKQQQKMAVPEMGREATVTQAQISVAIDH